MSFAKGIHELIDTNHVQGWGQIIQENLRNTRLAGRWMHHKCRIQSQFHNPRTTRSIVADSVAGLLAWRRTREFRVDLPVHAGQASMMG